MRRNGTISVADEVEENESSALKKHAHLRAYFEICFTLINKKGLIQSLALACTACTVLSRCPRCNIPNVLPKSSCY